MNMKRYDNDDELDRALFALDLEETPADLRSSILAGTIYHVPVSASIRPWEVWLYGGLCAALVWLLMAVVRGADAGVLSAVSSFGSESLAFFSQPATIFWIAFGGVAVVFSQMNLTNIPGYQRATRR